MRLPPFREIVGGVMALAGLLTLAYLAVSRQEEAAIGAIVLLIGQASGYVYRGRVAEPKP